jgi:hypothetical protein
MGDSVPRELIAIAFPRLVAELVRLNVDVIVTAGTPGALAAKQARTTIPNRDDGRRRCPGGGNPAPADLARCTRVTGSLPRRPAFARRGGCTSSLYAHEKPRPTCREQQGREP